MSNASRTIQCKQDSAALTRLPSTSKSLQCKQDGPVVPAAITSLPRRRGSMSKQIAITEGKRRGQLACVFVCVAPRSRVTGGHAAASKHSRQAGKQAKQGRQAGTRAPLASDWSSCHMGVFTVRQSWPALALIPLAWREGSLLGGWVPPACLGLPTDSPM